MSGPKKGQKKTQQINNFSPLEATGRFFSNNDYEFELAHFEIKKEKKKKKKHINSNSLVMYI